MGGLIGKAVRFARSPQGQRALRHAARYANSPEGRRQIASLRERASTLRAARKKRRH